MPEKKPNIEPILRSIKRIATLDCYNDMKGELKELEYGIMEYYNIPEDTTLLYENDIDNPKRFCRDKWTGYFCNYLDGEISFETFEKLMVETSIS